MKKPRLRTDVPTDITKAKQLICSRCKCRVFDEKFVVFETSALAPVNPGKVEKFPVLVCMLCNTILANEPPEKGKETIQ